MKNFLLSIGTLKMFVLFFTIFIFIFTVRENVWMGIIVFICIALCLFIFDMIKNRKIVHKKNFLALVLAIFLSMGSRLIYVYSYGETTQGAQRIFSGTGNIQDTYTEGKYIFADGASTYVLYSQKNYSIGDQIFLVGRMPFGTFSGSTGDQGFLSFDYTKRLKMKGWRGTIYESNSYKLRISDPGWIKQTKKNLQQNIISAYGKNKITGLILGMLIGDRSNIPKDDYQGFINSGLVHLIAVSGGNIVMIVVFLGLVLFFIPFYIRSGVILLTIIFYGLLCGMDSSVLRAVIAGGLSMLALFRGKEVPVWRLMTIAFIGMLLLNPYYLVYDVGFLMSFGAVIGIILITKKEENNKIPAATLGPRSSAGQAAGMTMEKIEGWTESHGIVGRGLKYVRKNYLQPSVGATLGVFPIIVFFMGKINLLSIVGNLFVLPIIPFVMIYGFVSVYLHQMLGRERLLRVERMLISYIYQISEISSSYGLYLLVQDWVKWAFLVVFIIGFVVRRSPLPSRQEK